MIRRRLVGLRLLPLGLLLLAVWAQRSRRSRHARSPTRPDAASSVPQRICARPGGRATRVGTPLHTCAGEDGRLGANATGPAEKAFLKESVRELPEYGRLTGRGGTANLENVLEVPAGPDHRHRQCRRHLRLARQQCAGADKGPISPARRQAREDTCGLSPARRGAGREGSGGTARPLRRRDAKRTQGAYRVHPEAKSGRGFTTGVAPTASKRVSPDRSTWKCWSARVQSTWRLRPVQAVSPRFPWSRFVPGTQM